jgi:predicted RNase H-like nuclease
VIRPVDDPAAARVQIFAAFAEILDSPEALQMIAVDIPIGLPELATAGGRACDAAARQVLGARRSSVFAVPARAAVWQQTYGDACRIAVQHSDPPRKISKQIYNIFPKIREVDALMTPDLQARVVECHPEVAFWRLNGRTPLDLPKKIKSQPSAEGLALRRELLIRAGYKPEFFDQLSCKKSIAGADDLFDAMANAAAAADILRGTAVRFPLEPPADRKGLRMEIWG